MTLHLLSGGKITLEKVCVASLEQILGPEDEDVQATRYLASLALFSLIPERRAFGLRALSQLWCDAACLRTLADAQTDILYAYLYFPTPDRYVLVGRYAASESVPEISPTDLERSLW